MGTIADPSPAGPTLIVGSTGFIGQFVTEACLASPFATPTYLLVRSSPTSPSKTRTLDSFEAQGAILIQGSMGDQDFMQKLLRDRMIRIVICATGGENILEQLALLKAIKAAGTVKRFLPSEFGHDIDRADPVEPGLTMYNEKRRVRRAVEEAGVPYTYICCNSIAAWPYHDNTHPADTPPPCDYFQIYGDGTVKAYFVAGTDIGKFTIKCMSDIRTLNKTVHFRPSGNLVSLNELAILWEKKLGLTLPRVTITEKHLLALADEMRIPESIVASFTHHIFIEGCQVNFSLDKPTDIEATSLYPEAPFRSIDDCLGDFVANMISAITPVVGEGPVGVNYKAKTAKATAIIEVLEGNNFPARMGKT